MPKVNQVIELSSMSMEEMIHYIAQGVINIDEGLTNIEKGSRVHLAMQAFCDRLSSKACRRDKKGVWIPA